MVFIRAVVVTLVAAVFVAATGCMKWKPPWDGADLPESSPSAADASFDTAEGLSAVG
jgi:hypothetical protein